MTLQSGLMNLQLGRMTLQPGADPVARARSPSAARIRPRGPGLEESSRRRAAESAEESGPSLPPPLPHSTSVEPVEVALEDRPVRRPLQLGELHLPPPPPRQRRANVRRQADVRRGRAESGRGREMRLALGSLTSHANAVRPGGEAHAPRSLRRSLPRPAPALWYACTAYDTTPPRPPSASAPSPLCPLSILCLRYCAPSPPRPQICAAARTRRCPRCSSCYR